MRFFSISQVVRRPFAAIALVACSWCSTLRAEHDGRIQILLLGDSTTEAKIPKMLAPQEPQFEDVIRQLLAAEGDLPPANVINSGVSSKRSSTILSFFISSVKR